jgi:hypothetical protein
MKMTLDLIFSGQAFQWMPAQVSPNFVNNVIWTYESYKTEVLPDLHFLTESNREVMLMVDSLRETGGKSTEYWKEALKGIADREERVAKRFAITDKYYHFALRDTERLLIFLRLSYYDSESPRNPIVHYSGEVW